MRVWDLMLYTKSVATLFQVALALVHMYAPALLATADVLDAFSVSASALSGVHGGVIRAGSCSMGMLN